MTVMRFLYVPLPALSAVSVWTAFAKYSQTAHKTVSACGCPVTLFQNIHRLFQSPCPTVATSAFEIELGRLGHHRSRDPRTGSAGRISSTRCPAFQLSATTPQRRHLECPSRIPQSPSTEAGSGSKSCPRHCDSLSYL